MNTYTLSIFLSLPLLLGSFYIHEGQYVVDFESVYMDDGSSSFDPTGKWKIDLRPTPDAAPYYQYLIISKVDEGRVYGTFYNSPIQYGNINTDWGKTVIAFVTQDAGGNTYHSTFETDGYSLNGTTHSVGRNLLSIWTGTKVIED